MPRPKSFVKNIEVETVKRAHNCKNNATHRLQCGDKRLRVKVNRTQEYYCFSCAVNFLERDIEILKNIVKKLQE